MLIFDTTSIIAYLCGLILAYTAIIILIKPIKWLLRIGAGSLFGGAILILTNVLGADTGLHIGVNFITAVIVGLLGLPGVIMLYVVQMIL